MFPDFRFGSGHGPLFCAPTGSLQRRMLRPRKARAALPALATGLGQTTAAGLAAHPGKVALREHSEATGRTDIHIFDQWCHLATLHDEAELQDAVASSAALAFDLDIYRLLVKHLSAKLVCAKTIYQ